MNKSFLLLPVLLFPSLDIARDETAMNTVAEQYVKLVLALGEYDADYVDAYYGPAAWRDEVKAQHPPVKEIVAMANDAIRTLSTIDVASSDTMLVLRKKYLERQLQSLTARAAMLEGKRFPFDEESMRLFDAVAPAFPASHFQKLVDELSRLLPAGAGSVQERFARFRNRFVIPKDRLDTVFQAAIAECRERTKRHLALPAGERFVVEYVTNKAWSGYNWYQGNSYSVIQVNTDLPIFIDRAIDLAAHEGYPGHHVYNTLLESEFVRKRGWVEYSVYPLFSPQSLIAEGSANFGIHVAFTHDERIAFEKSVLFPLAGLDTSAVDLYYSVLSLAGKLDYAGNEAARGYLNGTMTKEEAVDWLMKYTLTERSRAEQRLRFIDKYRSYVINYNFGQDLVRQYVERNGGTANHPDIRWSVFGELLASPRLPDELR